MYNLKHPVIFPYFAAPEEDIAFRVNHQCYFCGEWKPCFMVFPLLHSGCMTCLLEDAFGFDHDSEWGYLTEDGFTRDYRTYQLPPAGFAPHAFQSLRRTPPFAAWHDATWLVHCNDFMHYTGRKVLRDFLEEGGSLLGAKELFIQQTWMERLSESADVIWDRLLGHPETTTDHWDIRYYAFTCTHCGIVRGYFDFP
ncbi:MAG TPA: CbrC family protein [Rhodothermales bacterium]|nr:CbrC family protein [Rhodothermales bacterium]